MAYPFLQLSGGIILTHAGHSDTQEYLLSNSKSLSYVRGFLSLFGYCLSLVWLFKELVGCDVQKVQPEPLLK